MFSVEQIENLFSYHLPDQGQVERLERLRSGAKAYAKIVLAETPPGPDQSTAIRKLRESVMTANASIVLEAPKAPRAGYGNLDRFAPGTDDPDDPRFKP